MPLPTSYHASDDFHPFLDAISPPPLGSSAQMTAFATKRWYTNNDNPTLRLYLTSKERGMAKSGLFQGSEAVAEAARDKAAYSGFIAGLFEADVRWNLFNSIGLPEVSPAALEFLEGLTPLLLSLDPH